MKFLIDVNASRTLGHWLQNLGHDVAYVGDVMPTIPDNDILAWAVRERRIIVTTDSDFEQLIWVQQKPHCGVLRLENVPRSERQVLLEEALSSYAQVLEAGAIVIATRNKFRVRRTSS